MVFVRALCVCVCVVKRAAKVVDDTNARNVDKVCLRVRLDDWLSAMEKNYARDSLSLFFSLSLFCVVVFLSFYLFHLPKPQNINSTQKVVNTCKEFQHKSRHNC